MQQMTATQRLADHLLGGKLDQFVAQRRGTTPPTSWRRIALDLRDQVGIDVTHETVRGWYIDALPEKAAS